MDPTAATDRECLPLSQLQEKTNELSHQAASSAQNSVRRLEQTTQVAGRIIDAIHHQNAQLADVDDDLDEMDGHLGRGNDEVERLRQGSVVGSLSDVVSGVAGAAQRVWGGLRARRNGTDAEAQHSAVARGEHGQQRQQRQDMPQTSPAATTIGAAPNSDSGSAVVHRDYGAGNEEAQANMLAMDKNLDRVSALLHGLGSLAQEMGQQLDMQRSKVSTVAEKVDRNAEKQSIIMEKLGKVSK